MNISDASCASDDDLERLGSLNLLVVQIIGLIAIFTAFISTFFAVHLVAKKSIFEKSTKLLIYLILFYANFFQIMYLIEISGTLYRRYFKFDMTCEILQSEASCAIYYELIMAGTSGMIYGPAGLILERTFATFATACSERRKVIVQYFIFFTVFIASIATGQLIIWGNPLTGYVFACNVTPLSSYPRASVYYLTCCLLTCFNFVLSLVIMKYNKRYEYSTRFKVGARFQKREAIESTGTITFLALSLFFFMLIYSVGIYMFISRRSQMEARTFNTWVQWVYTMPLMAMMFPLLLIYRIRCTTASRAKKLQGIKDTRQSQEDHIKQINNMWR